MAESKNGFLKLITDFISKVKGTGKTGVVVGGISFVFGVLGTLLSCKIFGKK